MKRFAGFCRVSSREQEREGFSLDCQETAIRAHAEKLGGTIAQMFSVAESAKTSSAREAFRDLLDYVRQNRRTLDGVIFKSVDRAARNLQDLAELEKLQEAHGVRTYMVDGSLDASNPAGELSIGVQGVLARFAIRQNSEKIIEARDRRVEEGLFPNKAPYGYANYRDERGRSLVRVHPENSQKVRVMFELYAKGDLTIDGLRERMRAEGFVYTTRTESFTRSKVHSILRDRAYRGEVFYKGAWHPGTHEPLISRTTFEQVQAKLGDRRYSTHEATFAGMMSCGECGRRITGEVIKKDGRSYVYYRCSRYTATGHGRHRLRDHKLEEQIVDFLQSLRLDDRELRDWFVTALRARTHAEQGEAKEQRSRLQGELTRVRDRLDSLLDLHLDNEIDKESYHRKAQQLRDRAAELEDDMHASGEDQTDRGETAVKAFELADQLSAKWLTADPATKRLILDIVSLNLTLNGATLEVVARSPFDLLLEEAGNENGRSERI